MAIRTKEEILDLIKGKLNDDTSDEAIALVEDINDTFEDLSVRVSEAGDWKDKYEKNDAEWKEKYEKNDADWRKKYKERFFSPSKPTDEDQQDEDDEDKPKKLTFEALFKNV